MMILSKDEKVLVLLYRIEKLREQALFGVFSDSPLIVEYKIRKLKDEIVRLGGNYDMRINLI